jgi:hypothetical protein
MVGNVGVRGEHRTRALDDGDALGVNSGRRSGDLPQLALDEAGGLNRNVKSQHPAPAQRQPPVEPLAPPST